MGAEKLREDAGPGGIEEAQAFIQRFHATYPRIMELTVKSQLTAVTQVGASFHSRSAELNVTSNTYWYKIPVGWGSDDQLDTASTRPPLGQARFVTAQRASVTSNCHPQPRRVLSRLCMVVGGPSPLTLQRSTRLRQPGRSLSSRGVSEGGPGCVDQGRVSEGMTPVLHHQRPIVVSATLCPCHTCVR